MTTHEEIKELIPAYALGALDSQEAELLLRHFSTCDECPRELEAYRRLVEGLASALAQKNPSPRVKQKIMARLETREARLSGFAWNRLAMVWLPVSLVLLAFLLFSTVVLSNQLAKVTQAPPISVVALQGTEFAPQAKGMLVAFPEQEIAMLIVEDMPILPSGWEYQLWLVRDEEKYSGGTLDLSERGRGYLLVEMGDFGQFQMVGITVEPEGGSPAPTGDGYMWGSM